MIQKTTQRQLNAALGNPTLPTPDGPEPWGQSINDRHYSLEVIQDPLRARMCGFGDKDRRPLAPAAVAKMIVRGEDNKILDVDDVDVDFFIVTVDLWSADAKQEMNLVLHPTTGDRHGPARLARARKRAHGASGPPSASHSRSSGPRPYPAPRERPRQHTNHPPGPSEFTLRPIDPPPSGTSPLLTPASTQSHNSPGYPFSPQSDFFSGAGPTSDAASPWSLPSPVERAPFQAPTLPSIHALGCGSPLFGTDSPFASHSDPPDLTAPFRGWADGATGLFDTHAGPDPVLRDACPPPAPAPAPVPTEAWTPVLPVPQPQHAFQPFGERDGDAATRRRLTYTRTLVGPLSANAQRLQDEHRQRGIFFLFQDLSVRTEGTFRLRMRLMNVGAPPAPNALSNAVHTGVSPVLAQSFTAPFTVYSAKRFPGVPDTTALSIAFGNQGQKLPLRNRHGRRRRPGAVSSDDESF